MAAALLKESDPTTEVVVHDRDPGDAAYGFGVVFSASSLHNLKNAVPWLHDDICAAGRFWDDIEMRRGGDRTRLGGNGFGAVARAALLQSLRRRAQEVGVVLRDGDDVADPTLVDADLVLGADGVSSQVRQTFAEAFSPGMTVAAARFVWFGAYADFEGLTFLFERSEHGWFAVHGYPYDAEGRCTFLVETDPQTLDRAAATDGVAPNPGHNDEVARRFCAQLFAGHLRKPDLLVNNSVWRNFVTLRTDRWSHGRYVLLGDAAHTAHFSVGSGTTMALEDAIALAAALRHEGDVGTGLRRYEDIRRPAVERLQAAAHPSMGWWENFRRYMDLPAPQLAMHFLSRTGRVTHERASRQDPAFVRRVDRWFSGGEGIDTVLGTPFDGAGWTAAGRLLRLDPTLDLGVGPARPIVLRADTLEPADAHPGDGVAAVLLDDVRGAPDVEDRVTRGLAAVADGAALAVVRANPPDGEASTQAQLHISERLRLEHGVPTALVDDTADRGHAAQLVLSGRADLVAVPVPAATEPVGHTDQRIIEPSRR
jgi:anthraniloyl-CoA monooxygenase